MSTQPARGHRPPQSSAFTEAMRDRQARGKDPEESSDEFEYVPITTSYFPSLCHFHLSSHRHPSISSPSTEDHGPICGD